MKKLSWLLIIALFLGCFTACQNPAGSDQATESLPIENEDGTLAQRVKEEIAMHWPHLVLIWADDADDYHNTRYYGTYDGYVVFFRKGGLDAFTDKKYDKYTFSYSSDFSLYAYKEGEFYMLEDIYEQGLINDEAIEEIWNTHRGYGN